jgi:hypothetical protein
VRLPLDWAAQARGDPRLEHPPKPGCGCSTSRSTGSTPRPADEFQEQLAARLAHGAMAVIASHQPFEVPGLKRIALADYAP